MQSNVSLSDQVNRDSVNLDSRPIVCDTLTSKRLILGIPIHVFTSQEMVLDHLLCQRAETGLGVKLAFANAHLLSTLIETGMRETILHDFVLVNDGLGVDLASRILYGVGFPCNLNGTDLMPAFLHLAPMSFRVFLLGSAPGIAEIARTKLAKEFPRHEFVGVADGFFDIDNCFDLVVAIKNARADVLLVGMGNPRQEVWLHKYFTETGCSYGFAVGAFLDFAANAFPRAPFLLRKLHLEWLFRLTQEPHRLFRRYTVEICGFLFHALQEKLVPDRMRQEKLKSRERLP